jgi:hypothetical protein
MLDGRCKRDGFRGLEAGITVPQVFDCDARFFLADSAEDTG